MENQIMIAVADYSKYPSGRDDHDGSFNGEKFRKTILLPAVIKAKETGQKVTVTLQGVLSFGSSFLEESFGGLVRCEGFSAEELETILNVDPGRPNFSRHVQSIWKHIESASKA